jgi:tetraacyldisaccharide 4'-kinase
VAVKELAAWAAASEATAAVCTHKDLVKLNVNSMGSVPLRAVIVGLEFMRGQEVLEAKLEKLLAKDVTAQ